MEYILHIGLPKTGSTSLQRALWDNREIFRRHGVVYPNTGIANGVRPKHLRLMQALAGNPEHARMPKDWIDRFYEETAGADICILSCENFSGIAKPEMVTSLIPRENTRVVMYVREPVAYIVSRWRHNVLSRNFTMSLREFAEIYHLPFLSAAERWVRIFGRERFVIRLNDYSDSRWNIVSDFLNLIGLEMKNSFPMHEYYLRPGIGGNLLFVKRLLNFFITNEENSSAVKKEIRQMINLDQNFRNMIPVDKDTVDLITSRSQQDLEVLERRCGLSVKAREKPIAAPPWPDQGNLKRDFKGILDVAKEGNGKLAPLLERMTGLFALHR